MRALVEAVSRLLWVGTLGGALLGGLNYVMTRAGVAEISAPQMAALSAESLTYAIIPYVFARAWDEALRTPRAHIEPVGAAETRAA